MDSKDKNKKKLAGAKRRSKDVIRPNIIGAKIENFTVHRRFDECFSGGINLAIGANGVGKTHLLRILYTTQRSYSRNHNNPAKFGISSDDFKLAFGTRKLSLISFGAEEAIISIISGSGRVNYTIFGSKQNILGASISGKAPNFLMPIFIETAEVVSRASWLVGASERYADLGVSTTQIDTAKALLAPMLKLEKISVEMHDAYTRLAKEVGARPRFTDSNDVVMVLDGGVDEAQERTPIKREDGTVFFPAKPSYHEVAIALAAEGHRKLAQVMILLQNGSITPGMTLYWDEPETNLNPKLLRLVAEVLVDLAVAGVQIFVATHSFFLMKEVDLLLLRKREELGIVPPEDGSPDKLGRFFAFRLEDGAVAVERGHTLTDIDTIASLDAELDQEDRAQRYYWGKATERKQS